MQVATSGDLGGGQAMEPWADCLEVSATPKGRCSTHSQSHFLSQGFLYPSGKSEKIPKVWAGLRKTGEPSHGSEAPAVTRSWVWLRRGFSSFPLYMRPGECLLCFAFFHKAYGGRHLVGGPWRFHSTLIKDGQQHLANGGVCQTGGTPEQGGPITASI